MRPSPGTDVWTFTVSQDDCCHYWVTVGRENDPLTRLGAGPFRSQNEVQRCMDHFLAFLQQKGEIVAIERLRR